MSSNANAHVDARQSLAANVTNAESDEMESSNGRLYEIETLLKFRL